MVTVPVKSTRGMVCSTFVWEAVRLANRKRLPTIVLDGRPNRVEPMRSDRVDVCDKLTVQRNGRLRRVNGWAAMTGEKLRCAYPAFPGTRDHRLVQIMKKRVDSFSLLLGGVMDIDLDELVSGDERWRNAVIAHAKTSLQRGAATLRALEI